MNGKQDGLWPAILQEHERLQATGLRTSVRGAGYRLNNSMLCIATYYPSLNDTTKHVYHITAWLNLKGEIEVKSEGPFIDSANQYWDEMLKRDSDEGNAIVTADFQHYTIHPDSKNPGWGDGHGGSLFEFKIDNVFVAERFIKAGLNVEKVWLDGERPYWILRSRNVWSQNNIPMAHRSKFPVNAELLPPKIF